MPTPVVPTARSETRPELATALEPCAPLFHRATSRASVERSLTGWRTDLPRQHCETLAAAVAETATERWPPLCTDATWEPQTRDQQRVRTLGAQRPPPGLLILDDPGRAHSHFPGRYVKREVCLS
jgi:hypothetical protein